MRPCLGQSRSGGGVLKPADARGPGGALRGPPPCYEDSPRGGLAPSPGARALLVSSMGDSGPRRAEAGAAQGNLLAATGSVHPAGLRSRSEAAGPPRGGPAVGGPSPTLWEAGRRG